MAGETSSFDWSGVAAAGVGGGLGLLGSLGSSLLGQRNARVNMKAQYNYALKAARNMPKAQREGYEAAGYNPMLALSGGSAHFMPNASAPAVPDFAGSARDGAELADLIMKRQSLENQKIKAEIDKTESSATRDKVGTWMDVLGPVAGVFGTYLGAKKLAPYASKVGKKAKELVDIPLKNNTALNTTGQLLKRVAPIVFSAPLFFDAAHNRPSDRARQHSNSVPPKTKSSTRPRPRYGNAWLTR